MLSMYITVRGVYGLKISLNTETVHGGTLDFKLLKSEVLSRFAANAIHQCKATAIVSTLRSINRQLKRTVAQNLQYVN